MLHRLVVVAVLVGSGGSAHAERRAIVIEAYSGERPPDADKLLAPLREELSKMSFVVEPEALFTALRDKGMRPPIVDGLPADFAQQVAAGHDEYFNGNYRGALDKLVPLVERARNNPGEFAIDQSKRDVVRKALIDIGMAHKRVGDINASKRAFRDLVSSFADAPVLRAQHGNDAADAYDDAKKDLGSAMGKIEVETGDQQAAVYINERQIDLGSKVTHQVPPGEYRVLLKLGGQLLSRVRVVTVEAGATRRVAIHAGLESALHVSKDWVGLVFRPGAKRSLQEGIFAKVFADQLDAAGIVVIGLDEVNGKPHVMAALIQLTDGADIKRGSILMSSATESDRRELAQFATGKKPASGNIIDLTPRNPEKVPWGGWKFITGAAAVAGLGIGAYLVSIDGDCNEPVRPCPTEISTAAPGYATLGAGVALAALTVYLIVKSPKQQPRRTAFVAPTGGGALVGLTGRF